MVIVTAIAAGVGIFLYRLLCVWHNRKRDASGIMEGFEHAYDDDATDVKVEFLHYSLCYHLTDDTPARTRNSDISCSQPVVG